MLKLIYQPIWPFNSFKVGVLTWKTFRRLRVHYLIIFSGILFFIWRKESTSSATHTWLPFLLSPINLFANSKAFEMKALLFFLSFSPFFHARLLWHSALHRLSLSLNVSRSSETGGLSISFALLYSFPQRSKLGSSLLLPTVVPGFFLFSFWK